MAPKNPVGVVFASGYFVLTAN